jgi:Protein of unknown function (DUF3300)
MRMLISALTMMALAATTIARIAQPPAPYPPSELERLVMRIALYPDPLLAQVLAAATYPDQVAEAAQWADEHHYLTGEALARAIADDHLPWDPSVQALLPFPSVLQMMASDMVWTAELGNAFLDRPQEVMDAVQRLRKQAKDYGYLRSNAQIIVSGGPYIEILPASPNFICVPFYDPLIVFAPPRPGFAIAAAIRFGYVVPIGPAFRLWGWGRNRILWNTHTVILNNTPWVRVRGNRLTYVHPYAVPRWTAPRPPERHPVIIRTPREIDAARRGHARIEDHHRHR